MNYIIFDLEFNQGFDIKLNKTVSNEKCPFEIIQLGAIKLDKNLKIIDTFSRYVKPNIYTKIHPFVSKMTNITYNTVKGASCFNDVYNDFLKFVGDDETIFVVWGGNDIKELFRNINFYNLSHESLTKNFINIQTYASKYLNNPLGKNIGLQNAIKLLNIKENLSYHDAINDAYYTAEIFTRIYNKKIKTETFSTEKTSKTKKTRTRDRKYIDYDALFNEFKSILKKDLTAEEKDLIVMSFKMGKRGEFLIDKKYN